MKKITSLLMMALLAIGMGLTSCDEQLDNAVNPGVGEVTKIEFDLSKIDAKYLDSEKTKLQLTVGDVVTLSFTILPEEAADTKVELTAGDATILSIDGLKVTVLKEGETKVTAKAGDKTAVIPVTVAAKGPVDLSMVDCAGNARTSMSTANCYMVHTAGDYKLPLVYGNAIKNGEDNKKAYNPGGSTSATYCANFINHAGNAINAPWITKATTGTGADKGMGITVKSAALLWQDAEGLITAVDIDGDYLMLTVGKDATKQQGNAIVAAKDADDKIVWSWHIWVTTETFAADDLTTVTTGTGTLGTNYQIYKVTPVNLGWVPTGGDGKQGYNTYYQWGRKDAFIPGTWNATTNHTVYNINNNEVTGLTPSTTDATIADNIKNPTTHYYNSSTNGPCDTKYYNMWDAQQTSTGDIKTATVKTVYDPCPAGFCVPTGNLYYFMCNGGHRYESNWDGTNKGKTWQQTIYSSNTTGPDLYFPASGHRKTDGGYLTDVGVDNCGGYGWSASPGGDSSSHSLDFRSNVWGLGNNHRANGFPVRAVAEE